MRPLSGLGAPALAALLKRSVPDAVIAAYDHQLPEMLAWLEERRLSIPVIGCDGLKLAGLPPDRHTVAAPLSECGRGGGPVGCSPPSAKSVPQNRCSSKPGSGRGTARRTGRRPEIVSDCLFFRQFKVKGGAAGQPGGVDIEHQFTVFGRHRQFGAAGSVDAQRETFESVRAVVAEPEPETPGFHQRRSLADLAQRDPLLFIEFHAGVEGLVA